MEVMVKGRCGTFVGMIDWSYILLCGRKICTDDKIV